MSFLRPPPPQPGWRVLFEVLEAFHLLVKHGFIIGFGCTAALGGTICGPSSNSDMGYYSSESHFVFIDIYAVHILEVLTLSHGYIPTF